MILFDNSVSKPFTIKRGVKKDVIWLQQRLTYSFPFYFDTRLNRRTMMSSYTPDRMADCSTWRASKRKQRCEKAPIGEMLLADAAACTVHTQEELLRRVGALGDACRGFGLTISRNKTKNMDQDIT
jgi:hypothetical protein